jgi:hypothetical protein
MFGAIRVVSPQKLGGYIGATKRVGQIAAASLAPALGRRHGIHPTALRADCGGRTSPARPTHDSAKVALNRAARAATKAMNRYQNGLNLTP